MKVMLPFHCSYSFGSRMDLMYGFCIHVSIKIGLDTAAVFDASNPGIPPKIFTFSGYIFFLIRIVLSNIVTLPSSLTAIRSTSLSLS